MKLGFYLCNQYLPQESMNRKIDEHVEQVRAARDAGFDLICTGQHYLASPYQMPTSLHLLARLAPEAGEMQVASTIVLLPLHNPVDMAESVTTMDAICNGRFIFGVGLGYREEEYSAFGIRRQDRVPRLLEALELMKLLWTQNEVEFEGSFYRVPKITPTTRPIQKPHPPIWLAANNDSAIQRAGRLGYPWLINPHSTLATVERQIDLYWRSLEHGAPSSLKNLPMLRELYVAEDKERAFYESRPYLESKYSDYVSWGQDKALPGEESFSMPYEDLAKDRFLIGTPEDIVKEIKRYEGLWGLDWMIFRMQWPGMKHDAVMNQIELMGKHVIPQINR